MENVLVTAKRIGCAFRKVVAMIKKLTLYEIKKL